MRHGPISTATTGFFGALFSIVGAAVGFTLALFLPKEHVLLYEASAVGGGGRLRVSPLVTPHAQGAVLSFTWGGR